MRCSFLGYTQCRRALLFATSTSHLKCPHGLGRESSAVAFSICSHTFVQKPRCQSRRPYSRGPEARSRDGKGEGEPNISRGRLLFDRWFSNILKGIAVILLAQAAFKEVAVPWYKAYQRKEPPTASKPKEIAASSSRKFTSSFPNAKCTTNNNNIHSRRSQQYNFLAEAVEKAAPSVVFIQVSPPSVFGHHMAVSAGSGFIVSEDGHVVTNAHVVRGVRSVKVKLASGKEVRGIVTDIDEVNDLALLKLNVKEKLPHLEFGDSSTLRPGEWVVALGSPLSLSNTITAGIVSSSQRPSKELGLHHLSPDMTYVQTDAYITKGNSGGPLVNLDGKVIGVNTYTLKTEPGISLAISSNFVKNFVECAKKKAQGAKMYTIGVGIITLTPKMHHLQLLGIIPEDLKCIIFVTNVWPSSAAAQAGLEEGDVIVEINGEEIESIEHVKSLVQSGKMLNMTIVRQSKKT